MSAMPKHFLKLQERYGQVMDSLKALGEATYKAGPVDEKHAHMIQLAAAAALRSEGAVHSHTRRALNAGASAEEIRHTIVLLTPTIGFPTVSAALSWVDDILEES